MAITDALPDMEREIKFFPVENKNPRTLSRDQVDQFNERGYTVSYTHLTLPTT